MADHLGSFNASSTIYFYFTTHAASGAAVAPSSAFEAADLKIYKNGSATERTSASGITMTSPFDSVTGLHAVAIDLSDNTDAGFYAAGSEYVVVLSPDETVDSLAVVKVLAYFSIERVVKVNVTQFGGSAGTFASGRPDVNTTYIGGTAQTARDLGASVLLSSGTGTGQISLSSGAVLLQATQTGVTIPTVTNLTNAPGAGDFTATMKTSIGTAVAASAVASVTGNVGGNVTGSVGSVVGAVGSVTGNVGGNVTGSVGSVATGGITAASIAADAIGASELAADAVAEIATAVWSYDATTSSRPTAGGTLEECHSHLDNFNTLRLPAALVGGRMDCSVGAHSTAAKAEINAEVVDALATDTYAEPGQGTPAATLSLAAKINYLFKAWRNRSTQTSTAYKLYADDATTVDQKATVSDDATTFDRNEITTGP